MSACLPEAWASPKVVRLVSLAFVLGLIGAVTATVGNTAAFNQTNIKRLLARSSIAHAGYIMCGISLLVSNNLRIVRDGVNQPMQAILVYPRSTLHEPKRFHRSRPGLRATGQGSLRLLKLGRRTPLGRC